MKALRWTPDALRDLARLRDRIDEDAIVIAREWHGREERE